MNLKNLFLPVLCALRLGLALTTAAEPSKALHTFAIGTNQFLLDGQAFEIRCGEIHAARVPEPYWRSRLKMARAMGLNTICAYLFWNQIEPRPGQFDWSGQADLAEFCRIAQEEGLWVILRPGPYSCAEWEMGGTPWWLLKDEAVQLRSRDPHYLGPAKSYLKEVGRVLGPLQITHGGPIIMVQVENEYGFYGNDAAYITELKNTLQEAGFEVPLFQCNPPDVMKNGLLTNLFQAANFGSDPRGNFTKLRALQPQGPLLCSEFYPGWFDTWGQPHHYGNTPRYLADLKAMLEVGASFSIYMVHGGTTFGLWSGCDRPFKPDTASYDYDAPISEAGWPTAKFFQTRELFSHYLLPGEVIPDPPATNAVITFAPVELKEIAPLSDNLPAALEDAVPRNMEAYDQGYGCIWYRTTLPAGPASLLQAAAIHDFGYVFLDGERVGILDRRTPSAKLMLPVRRNVSRLDILVEPMGRINFGPEMADHKGLIAPVKLGGEILKSWEIFRLPLDGSMLANLNYTQVKLPPAQPAFWRGSFLLNQPGDTFLDLRGWGKGDLWVNGHCLGRYWNVGPTQTAYTPGCWLHAGTNEIVILDLLGPAKPEVAGLARPILDELHPEKDFAQSRRPHGMLNLASVKPALSAEFMPGAESQDVKLPEPVKGRYFCLESLSAFDGKPFAAVAELDLFDARGLPISHDGWTIAYVDSEERTKEDGTAENAIDGQTADYWHTEWSAAEPAHPHQIVVDLGQSQTISSFRYVPRQSPGAGRIKNYRIYVGENLILR
ncbi:MAG TPA: beta-galactosidase [Candidatus Angelobacter sp.]|nr:beta-galactosidase [Candidatus Angelobacter sp.]